MNKLKGSHSGAAATRLFLFFAIAAGFFLLSNGTVAAQPPTKKAATEAVRSSPAYAELLLKRAELESELGAVLLDYTEEFPKVKEMRQTVMMLSRDLDKLSGVKPADAGKLTLALGKLMVRRVDLETDLWRLQESYADGHPDVKRAKKRVEIFEKAIAEILN